MGTYQGDDSTKRDQDDDNEETGESEPPVAGEGEREGLFRGATTGHDPASAVLVTVQRLGTTQEPEHQQNNESHSETSHENQAPATRKMLKSVKTGGKIYISTV